MSLQFGGEEEKMLEFEPEIIYENSSDAYLKWEADNGYLVVYAMWYDDVDDWKQWRPWNYCIYSK